MGCEMDVAGDEKHEKEDGHRTVTEKYGTW